MLKKVTIYSGVSVLVLLGFFAFWKIKNSASVFSFSSDKGLGLIDNSLVQRFNETTEKRVGQTGIVKLANDNTSFPVLSLGGKTIVYYVKSSGEIKSITSPSQIQESNFVNSPILVAKIKPGAKSIAWSPDRNELIGSFDNGLFYFNLKNGSSKKLDSRILRPSFSKSTNDVAYLFFDFNDRSGEISVSDPKAEVFKSVIKTRFDGWILNWIGSAKISASRPSSGQNSTLVFVIDKNNGSMNKVIDSRDLVDFSWSPDSNKLLYSIKKSDGRVSLSLKDLAQNTSLDLNISSLSSKCIWGSDSKSVYCAIPDGGTRADDISQKTEDSIGFIDLSSGNSLAIKTIANSSVAGFYSISDLGLTPLGNYIFFRDSLSGNLFSLRLGQ